MSLVKRARSVVVKCHRKNEWTLGRICGDKCLVDHNSTCNCGNTTFIDYDSKYCCIPINETCKTQGMLRKLVFSKIPGMMCFSFSHLHF